MFKNNDLVHKTSLRQPPTAPIERGKWWRNSFAPSAWL